MKLALREVGKLFEKAKEYDKKKKAMSANPMRIHADTFKVLKSIQKRNNFKSISATIDHLIMTVALIDFTEQDMISNGDMTLNEIIELDS